MMLKKVQKGFTLIELMIVVVIIGILAAIAIPRFSGVSRSAKQSEAHSILKQIYTLQEAYYQRNNNYAQSPDAAATNGLVGYDTPTGLKYFDTPTISASGTTFCASMTTSAGGTGLENRSINQNKQFYNAASCGGTAIDP